MDHRLNLNRLKYLTAVAEEGTFTAAAERLGVAKSVVSKQISLLEEELGVALILRNSRYMRLSEAGQDFFERARAVLDEVNDLYRTVSKEAEQPRGTIRLTAPVGFASRPISQTIAAFSQLYPLVELHVSFSDQTYDVMETGFDLAIHGGWLRDSDHKARKLASFQEVAVASPDLLARYAKKGELELLQDLPFIAHRALYDPTSWQIKDRQGQVHDRRFIARIHMDSTHAIAETVLAGAGFAILPDYAIAPQLKSGQLINLLPNHSLREGGIYAVLPNQKFRSIAVIKFLDMLVEAFRSP